MKHVESLFFGSSGHLFGMYHPATGQHRNHGIVVCAPLFHEYYRTHFAMKRIAVELADKGYDVLRFDYSGTGDSKGDVPSDMFNQWSSDIGEAMTEVRELSGSNSISLVTLRFGASLALPWQGKANRCIRWDAIPDYHDYADQLDATNSASLAEHGTMASEELAQLAADDYLGTGLSREVVSSQLVEFVSRTDVRWLDESASNSIAIQSDSDWISPSLTRIHAHDTVRQIIDAL